MRAALRTMFPGESRAPAQRTLWWARLGSGFRRGTRAGRSGAPLSPTRY